MKLSQTYWYQYILLGATTVLWYASSAWSVLWFARAASERSATSALLLTTTATMLQLVLGYFCHFCMRPWTRLDGCPRKAPPSPGPRRGPFTLAPSHT